MVGHCAEAYWTNMVREGSSAVHQAMDAEYYYVVSFILNSDIIDNYVNGSFVKTICEARNKNHLLKAVQFAKDMGLKEKADFGLIYDKCLTELKSEEEEEQHWLEFGSVLCKTRKLMN